MAAQEIRATYDDLRAVSTALDNLATRTDAVYNDIKANRDALDGEWMGFGFGSFSSEMDGEIVPGIKKLANALRTAGSTTTMISTQFETTETEEGQKINGISAPSLLSS